MVFIPSQIRARINHSSAHAYDIFPFFQMNSVSLLIELAWVELGSLSLLLTFNCFEIGDVLLLTFLAQYHTSTGTSVCDKCLCVCVWGEEGGEQGF